MGVDKYKTESGMYWKVDEWLKLPDGQLVRFRQRKIPTKEQAVALVAKVRAEAFENRFFDRLRTPTLTVAEAWAAYEPITKRDNDAWKTDLGRAVHLLRHLGDRRAVHLTEEDVNSYRDVRLAERTKRGGPPTPATLDREVELLKRMLNYAVRCNKLVTNPVAKVQLLHKPNVRRSVLKEDVFTKLVEAAEATLQPILLVAYDAGLRKREVLDLLRSQVDLTEGCLHLTALDTKTDEGRQVYLTKRTLEALRRTPTHIHSEYVFVNPETGKPWRDIRKMFHRACKAAGLPTDLWFHDQRRSFVTNARRRGVPESVVMRMSGHKTRSVFDRYNIVEEEDLREAVKRIEAGISGQDQDKVGSSKVG